MKMDIVKCKGLLFLGLLVLEFSWFVHGNVVFPVFHKFKGRENSSPSTLKSHDTHRHARFLSAVDLTLGGNGLPTESGLYYAKIGIGTPAKDFYVHVDTGSDILWINCAGCNGCPKKTDLGALYDPKSSNTSSDVGCGQNFCIETYGGEISSCKPEIRCSYKVNYADGSSSSGYFVKDHVTLNQVSANFQTAPTIGDVIFGCGNQQVDNREDSSTSALDGLIGFGRANSSMISQLASAGKVRKMFAHCLDNVKGGGIFAIGEVVQPKLTKTTPLLSQMYV
ncbi:aspartic proteinase-like protein 2 [Quillaja saponaria]|uniref:Aspartic proteinase-like protein 2 n=1 Tax=Quillaja saponaria TaxID=32244 RepID=A0AAD7QJK4_QUISA|nr:aspartic proteinase-like protein 2 [Quillaja saponaria]